MAISITEASELKKAILDHLYIRNKLEQLLYAKTYSYIKE